ncbi:hypothetical protein DDIC_07975 [Desulfovibrio desulfuricans]|uniref:Porin n=2 Tax=Desulfovibrio desulfuricans TaxID=876 RepID=A0A4P7UM67_DESDE|nr:hypothetical protein DDIC_07975 [Desulfovibrio desulfuricans]
MRIQLNAVASEALSGTLHLEIGKFRWGQTSSGAALGADGTNSVKVKHSYLDWTMPKTDLKIRMGIQTLNLPSFTTDSNILGADVAGIVTGYKINQNISASAFWIRPYNDNYVGGGIKDNHQNFLDNMDLFGATLPMTVTGLNVTPWVMVGMIGPNTIRVGDNYFCGSAPIYYTRNLTALSMGMKKEALTSYGTAFWTGLTGEVTALDPFHIAWDFNYGSTQYDDASASRRGWLASLVLEYKMNWGIPGLVAWYTSGDDDDTSNGSERMPYTNVDEIGYGSFGSYAFFGGRPSTDRNSMIGHSMAGTWGVGARTTKISLLENLDSSIRINLIGGTNDPNLIKKLHGKTNIWMSPNNYSNENSTGMENLYMTTKDTALECGITNTYMIYENLKLGIDASYMKLFLDKSADVWGNSRMNGKSDNVKDSWNVSLYLAYNF